MELVGIFDVVADKDDQVNMYDASYLLGIIPIMLFAAYGGNGPVGC